MRCYILNVFGFAIVAGVVVCSPAATAALPLSAGAAASIEMVDPLIEKVVVRRRAPARRIVRGRGRGISPGAAAMIGLGVAGVTAIIAHERRERERERRQQFYHDQQQQYGYPYGQQPAYARQPACGWQQQPTYDQYGNYRGDRAVQVCQ